MPIGIYTRTEKHREIISKSMIGNKNAKGKHIVIKSRKGIGIGEKNGFYGKKHNEESKEKMKLAKKKNSVKYWEGKSRSEETKKKISNFMQQKLKKPEFKYELAKRFSNGKIKFKDTKPEKIMYEALLLQCYLIIKQHYVKDVGFCDFCLPEYNIIIEVDGNYWHNYPYGTDNDRKRDKKLKELGYKVIRFWEDEAYNNIEGCIKKIKLLRESF